jgi:hypothetical protein
MICNQLAEMTFIAGDYKFLEFQVFDGETQTLVDLSLFKEIRWVLFPYGNSENPILNLKGSVVASDNTKFDVSIKSEYTENLVGLFVQQVTLIDMANKEFVPAQGYFEIIPKGQKDNSIIIE